ncbi:MAG: transposase [Planctomycetota bacterium]
MVRRAEADEKGAFDRLLSACFARARRVGLIDDGRQHTAAIDATGLETRHVSAHFKRRVWGKPVWHSAWPKLTAVFHAASQLIAGVVVGLGPTQDSPQFAEAMRQAAKHVGFTRVLADRGYDAEHNHVLCRKELGIRSTAIPINPRSAGRVWPKAHYRRMMKRNFPHIKYRQRAQAESGFSRHKRRLGSALTARNERTQYREMRLRVLTHNLMIMADHA